MTDRDPSADPTSERRLGSAANADLARQTFFTQLGEGAEPIKAKQRESSRGKYSTLEEKGPEIIKYYHDLKELAETLDVRMGRKLKEHEQDSFLEYKAHMRGVQQKIRELQKKANEEEIKTKEDRTIMALEGERERFMTEAMRLDKLCKNYKKEVDKWKCKAEALEEDRCFLADKIKSAKRQNKILRAAAERARSSAASALMVTKARAEAQENLALTAGDEQPLALMAPPQAEVARRPASASGADRSRPAAGSAAKRALEVRSRTPDTHTLALGASTAPATSSSMPGRLKPARSAASLGDSQQDGLLALPPSGSILGNRAEERYVAAINYLNESIAKEQQTVRMLQAVRANTYAKKSELEEFFLKCVDEARKDLMRKRHLTMNKAKPEAQRILEALLTNENILVCLYEKLFPHRAGVARSLEGPGGGHVHPEEAARLAREPLREAHGIHGAAGLRVH